MLVFYNVYFRLHYYFPFHRFVKRKTRIRAIGPDLWVPEYQGMPVAITIPKRASESPSVSAREAVRDPHAQEPLDNNRTIKRKTNLFVIHHNIFKWRRLSRLDAGRMKNQPDQDRGLKLFH
jgi:hypothetical protein